MIDREKTREKEKRNMEKMGKRKKPDRGMKERWVSNRSQQGEMEQRGKEGSE